MLCFSFIKNVIIKFERKTLWNCIYFSQLTLGLTGLAFQILKFTNNFSIFVPIFGIVLLPVPPNGVSNHFTKTYRWILQFCLKAKASHSGQDPGRQTFSLSLGGTTYTAVSFWVSESSGACLVMGNNLIYMLVYCKL